MELSERAKKLIGDMPHMTARKYVDESCSLMADLLEKIDTLTTLRDDLKLDQARNRQEIDRLVAAVEELTGENERLKGDNESLVKHLGSSERYGRDLLGQVMELKSALATAEERGREEMRERAEHLAEQRGQTLGCLIATDIRALPTKAEEE